MNSKSRQSNIFLNQKIRINLQPAPAWMAILALLFITIACIVISAGGILRFVFPLGATAVGSFLYFRYPIMYVSFTWWIWFITPLIRRLADYRGGGYAEPNLILLTPFLVVLITATNLIKHLPNIFSKDNIPFLLAFYGLSYGLCVGFLNWSISDVGIGVLDWFAPVLFGFYLFTNWRNYPSYRNTIQRTFIWGLLIMGIYGIVQFIIVPEWDKFWLLNSGFSSAGNPEPLSMRIWSTMNDPGSFANTVGAGLLILFCGKGLLNVQASVVGYIAFLLSLVRSAWGAWFIGLLTFFTSLKSQLQIRFIVGIFALSLLIIPLVTVEPLASTISGRFETITTLESDNSAQLRIETYNQIFDDAISNFVGNGIGDRYNYHSTVLAMLMNLGWLGTVPYFSSILLLFWSLFRDIDNCLDYFGKVARAISFSTFAKIFLGMIVLDVRGMVLWSFLCLGLASQKYYRCR